jgi:hypothetical protein
MYKKITHNIIEEHFDYPVEPYINGNGNGNGNGKVAAMWPVLPNSWNYTTAMKNQFNQFNGLLRSYLVSVLAENTDAEYLKSELIKSGSEFYNFFEPYYGQTNSSILVGHLSGFANAFVDFVNGVSSGQDVSNLRQRTIEKLVDFVNAIYTVNPQWWTNVAIKPDIYVTAYAQALMEQATARKAKNWSADSEAAATAANIIANGPVYPSPFNGNLDFSNILSNSIAQQFPSKFN